MSTRLQRAIEKYQKILVALQRSATTPITEPRDLSGLVKDFEMTYELAWKALKAKLSVEGQPSGSPRDVLKKAYAANFISNEKTWIALLEDRNATIHTYNEDFAKAICQRIQQNYLPLFIQLGQYLKSNDNNHL